MPFSPTRNARNLVPNRVSAQGLSTASVKPRCARYVDRCTRWPVRMRGMRRLLHEVAARLHAMQHDFARKKPVLRPDYGESRREIIAYGTCAESGQPKG